MKNDPLKKVCIILSALSLALGAAFVIMTAENIELKKNVGQKSAVENVSEETQPAVIMPEVSETTAVTEHVCPAVETVYIYDNGIDLIEFPPVEGAVLNDYDMESLSTLDKKRKALYGENGVKRSRFGIDVSSYQCDIDWERAAADDVEFAVIRLGYRGYETGQICEDRYFRRNIEGAAAAGLDVGVYFYSQAITPEEAAEEAEYVIAMLAEAGIPVTMPVVFDWEFVTDEDPARTDGMTGDIQTECCKAFCDRIAEAGYSPMYYATVSTALFRYDMGGLPYPLWLAEYAEKTQFIYDYDMWQYSCSGVVDGIEGLVDLNIYIEK
ncbi:MAG: glycoside hydrolase family 25 protein [Oscillospiraceae bacterium]|nr:glycoside hydrolase family 25 protein [Oscillospiraceae bacterium]